jgi:two-component SAPR family response regulator
MSKKLTNNIDKISKNIFVLAEEEEKTPYQWDGMPEFVQEDMNPYATIEVEFRTEKDIDTFRKLMEQPSINEKTKAIWFPARDRFRNSSYRYFGTK